MFMLIDLEFIVYNIKYTISKGMTLKVKHVRQLDFRNIQLSRASIDTVMLRR